MSKGPTASDSSKAAVPEDSLTQLTQQFESMSLANQKALIEKLSTKVQDTGSPSVSKEVSTKLTSDILKDRNYTLNHLKNFSEAHALHFNYSYSVHKAHRWLLEQTKHLLPEVYRVLNSEVPKENEFPEEWIIDSKVSKVGHLQFYHQLSATTKIWLLKHILPIEATNTWNTSKFSPSALLQEVLSRDDSLNSIERLLSVFVDEDRVQEIPRFTDKLAFYDEIKTEMVSAFADPYDGMMLVRIFNQLQQYPRLKSELLPKFRSLINNSDHKLDVSVAKLREIIRDHHFNDYPEYGTETVNSVTTSNDINSGQFRLISPKNINHLKFRFSASESPSRFTGTIAAVGTEAGPGCFECYGYKHKGQNHIFSKDYRQSNIMKQYVHGKVTGNKTSSNYSNNVVTVDVLAINSIDSDITSIDELGSTNVLAGTEELEEETTRSQALSPQEVQALYDSGATLTVVSTRLLAYSLGCTPYKIVLRFGNNTTYTCTELHLIQILLPSKTRVKIPAVFVDHHILPHALIISIKSLTKLKLQLVFSGDTLSHDRVKLNTGSKKEYIGPITLEKTIEHQLLSIALKIDDMLNPDDKQDLKTSFTYTKEDVFNLLHSHFTQVDHNQFLSELESLQNLLDLDGSEEVQLNTLQVAVLHLLLGHASETRITQMGYRITSTGRLMLQKCETCAIVKLKRQPKVQRFSSLWSSRVLQLVHLDTTGHKLDLYSGVKLFTVVLVDDLTKFSEVIVFKNKNSIAKGTHEMLTKWKVIQGKDIGQLKCDLGTEFLQLVSVYGYERLSHSAHDPANNGVAERHISLHKTFVELVMKPFTDKLIYSILYPYAWSYSNALKNRWINNNLDTTRVNAFLGRAPKAKNFPLFGSDIILMYQKVKVQGIFVYYDVYSGLHHFLLLKFPLQVVPATSFKGMLSYMYIELLSKIVQRALGHYTALPTVHPAVYGYNPTQIKEKLEGFNGPVNFPNEKLTSPTGASIFNIDEEPGTGTYNSTSPKETMVLKWINNLNEAIHEELAPIEIIDEVFSNTSGTYEESSPSTDPLFSLPVETSSSNRTDLHQPIIPSLNQSVPLGIQDADIIKGTSAKFAIPKSYHAAMKIPIFARAIGVEESRFKENDVMQQIDNLPDGISKLLHGFWNFSIKFSAYNNEFVAKARFIILGNLEKESNLVTAAPTLQITTFRLFLSIIISKRWTFNGLDISTAFHYALMKRDVFLKTPPGFKFINTKYVKLNKSTYGLRDSPVNFYLTLRAAILSFKIAGYELQVKENHHDVCAFGIYDTVGTLLGLIIMYVDDLGYAGEEFIVNAFTKYMGTKFTIKHTLQPSVFLGCELVYHADGKIQIKQTQYINKVAEQLKLTEGLIRPTTSPCPMTIPLKWAEERLEEIEVPVKTIQALVGVLLWISQRTFPHISYLVNYYSKQPRNGLTLKLLQWLFRYVYTNKNSGLWYSGIDKFDSNNLNQYVTLFTDAALDYSTSLGACYYFGNDLINWQSSSMPIYSSGSTVDSEFSALHTSVKHLLHIVGILYGLVKGSTKEIQYPMRVYTDNKPLHNKLHGYTQTIELPARIPKVQELRSWVVQFRWIDLLLIAGKQNPADVFTKSFSPTKYKEVIPILQFGSEAPTTNITQLLAGLLTE
ncbi:Copia protein [Wickerhamomyces ciferrii]|uniref:Copia protein n=1 Tax=Wickerhamomyces ciferrii (strain ATCC 14091 / BCRC 22168 / CBS 111 / JCM 3599 / NBRC 0793 / NRRL Y-1031 F-60-10) TaxID=1206466 RepID=K0KI06_WICCF|nr:Copia protein [Wickerhamomyces ciferrii]CCH44840.1 Copia protein [Wickerhamomyces ciferrii]